MAGLGLLALSAVPLALLARLGAESSRPFVFCAMKALSGLPCPFCGGIRATAALARGAPLEALFWNPAAVLLHAGLLLTGVLVATGRTPPWLRAGRSETVFRGALVVLSANWVWLVVTGR